MLPFRVSLALNPSLLLHPPDGGEKPSSYRFTGVRSNLHHLFCVGLYSGHFYTLSFSICKVRIITWPLS